MLNVEVIATEELGDRSYLAHDGAVAVVIDPQRDIDRVEALLVERGLELELVLETHIHNDYVTGGYQLAARTGARYVVNAEDPVTFDRVAVHAGDELSAGTMTVRVIATPGHTFTHLAYVISDNGPMAPVRSGGVHRRIAALRQRRAHRPGRSRLHRRAHPRPVPLGPSPGGQPAGRRPVYPTHGFGSFCSAGPAVGGPSGTIADERARNDAVLEPDEDTFVTNLVAGLTAYPAYYAHMAPQNLAGPGEIDLSPLPPSSPVSWPSASPLASGSSTCATAPPTPPSTSPAPSASSSPTVRHLARLGHPLEHATHPDRRRRRPGRRGPASARPHRHRPPRRTGHRHHRRPRRRPPHPQLPHRDLRGPAQPARRP